MDEFVRAVEATIFASADPLSIEEIQGHAGGGDVEAALRMLAEIYTGRGIELVERGGHWHFQTARRRSGLRRLRQARLPTGKPG